MDKFEWLSQLVRFDTTSHCSNLDLINYIKDALTHHGVDSHLIYDAVEPKANLFAIIPAHQGDQNGGIILSGHTDVVPVEGQVWDSDPFQATLRDDKIYGRGTCDMKGFIAVVMALLPEILKLKLSRPIYLAFSYDEEIGCRGAPFIIDYFQGKNIKPAACIVGEPTDMRPVVAHKGKQSFKCTVQGAAAHSSLTTQGCNAIEYAAEIISFIRHLAEACKDKGHFDQYFDVPFTTLTTNLIKGGNSQNTIPSHCEFIFEFRNLPQHDPNSIRQSIDGYIQNEILPKMQSEYPAANVIMEYLGGVPGFQISEEEELTVRVREVTKVKEIIKVAYATEASLFQSAEIPTILCGPGSIEQAHRANEYVAVGQLEKCEAFLREIVKEKSGV